MDWIYSLIAWAALSFPAAVFVGAFIRYGSGEHKKKGGVKRADHAGN